LKQVQGILYLEFSDAVEAGIGSDQYLRKAKSVGNKSIRFIDDPDDLRKVLIEYEPLKQEHKDLVKHRFGDPYKNLALQPIRAMVQQDAKAREFFLGYQYGDKKSLPIDVVNKYTAAASWLNMLSSAEENKKAIKDRLKVGMTDFWSSVIEIFTLDGIDLPTTTRRLFPKIDEYKSKGYSCLVSWRYGNNNSKKVSSEVAEAYLLELISQPYHDDHVIARAYNAWAVQNGHDEISYRTVCEWRRKNNVLISQCRDGNKAWYDKYGKVTRRKRPPAPLLRIESDDNELDLYFIQERVITDKKGKTKTQKNPYYRPVLYVVKDSFNDYPLGYAIGDTVNVDLIKLAYLSAIHHIKEITGGYYLPNDLQTDRWGLDKALSNDLALFFKSLCAVYMPATPKNARSKMIEQSFGKKWHRLLKMFPNYAGHNVTAASKINEDYLQLQKANFPTVDQAPDQVEQFINAIRNGIDEKTGKSLQQEWLEGFNADERSRKHQISDMQMLTLLGTSHNYQNTITNRGITPAINCIERTYEIPEEFYMQTVGRRVQVIYDRLDYSRILVDAGNVRFIAREDALMPSATLDFKEGDRTRLNNKLEEKKRIAQVVVEKKTTRQEILQRNRLDAESAMQVGLLLPKVEKQQAINNYHLSQNNNENHDPFAGM
jgi:hypothetical protein